MASLPDELRFELETPETNFKPKADRRVRIPEPLPVRLIAVADVRLSAPAGIETELDDFYVVMLGFERVESLAEPTYRAENFMLSFAIEEPPVVHDSLRPLGIEIPSLGEAEKKLIDAEMEYTRQRGLTPGQES